MPKAGQKRPPRKRQTATQPTVQQVGLFGVVGRFPGQPDQTLILRPSEFGLQQKVARALGEAWKRRSQEVSFSASRNQLDAIRHFLRFLSQKEVEELSEVTADVLMEFERHLVDSIPSTAARHADSVWTALRKVPGLPKEAGNMVLFAPAIAHHKSQPTEALTEAQLRAVIAAARKDVAKARYDVLDQQSRPYPMWHETLSLFVLLLFETALSVDVLKHLDFTDQAPTRVLDWDHNDNYVLLSFKKLRGGAAPAPQLYSRDGAYSSGTLLALLRDLTEQARQAAAGRKDLAVGPWLGVRNGRSPAVTRHFGRVAGVQLIPVMALSRPFAVWLEHHGISQIIPEGTKASFRAIRPAAKAHRIALTDTTGLHMVDLVDDHSPEVYSRRYTRSQRLMRELRETFNSGIAGRAEDVVRGFKPTVVTADGHATQGISEDVARQALDGEHEFGLTACTTPTDSPMPGQTPGELCGVAFRACFECPSAVVTPRHVNRMRRVRAHAEEQRWVVPPPRWEALWGQTVRFIDHALGTLAPEASEFEQEPEGVLDLGLRGEPK